MREIIEELGLALFYTSVCAVIIAFMGQVLAQLSI